MQRLLRGGAFISLVFTLIVSFDLLAPGVERTRIDVFASEVIKPGKNGPKGLVRSSKYGVRQYTPTPIAKAARTGDSISILSTRLINFDKRHILFRDGEFTRSAVTITCWYYAVAIIFIGLVPMWVCLRPIPWKPGLISGFWMAVLQIGALMVVAKAVSETFGIGETQIDGAAYWLVQGVFAIGLGGAFFLMIIATLSAWSLISRRRR